MLLVVVVELRVLMSILAVSAAEEFVMLLRPIVAVPVAKTGSVLRLEEDIIVVFQEEIKVDLGLVVITLVVVVVVAFCLEGVGLWILMLQVVMLQMEFGCKVAMAEVMVFTLRTVLLLVVPVAVAVIMEAVVHLMEDVVAVVVAVDHLGGIQL